MTIIVCVKIHDGLVVASDSTTSFFRNDEKFVQSYHNSNKIYSLYKGLPIGAMTCGSGNIESASISTLSKDFREQLIRNGPGDGGIDKASYTIEEITQKARAFLLEAIKKADVEVRLTYWIFGYSSGKALPEMWGLEFVGKDCTEPKLESSETDVGPRWAGEQEALDRLILGRTSAILPAAIKQGFEEAAALQVIKALNSDLYEPFVMPSMPIQDAIDLARYLVETTVGFSKSPSRKVAWPGWC